VKALFRIFMLFLLFAIVANFAFRIDLKKNRHELVGELAYFPSGFMLRVMAVGYQAVLADVVWLRFIQYYGEHRMIDLRFDYMYNILDILTTLDPRFFYAYSLGGLMLTHDAKKPDQAMKLMRKGMIANPDDWRQPFMYAFINYVFLRKYRIAEAYFRISAQKPGASDRPRRWAAFLRYKKMGDLETGLNMWADLYKTTLNQEEKAIAAMYIRDITMEIHLKMMNRKIADFEKKFGRKPFYLRELVKAGMLDSIPTEPHGEKYIINNGQAETTWKIWYRR
jgi:hypothetical protein